MKNRILALQFLLIILIYACSSSSVVTKDISAEQLSKFLLSDSLIVVLDVRRPSELSGEWGFIENSINIPAEDLEERIGELNEYKDSKIALICRSGNRSKKATAFLTEHGFNAVNVLGGMKEYSKIE